MLSEVEILAVSGAQAYMFTNYFCAPLSIKHSSEDVRKEEDL